MKRKLLIKLVYLANIALGRVDVLLLMLSKKCECGQMKVDLRRYKDNIATFPWEFENWFHLFG